MDSAAIIAPPTPTASDYFESYAIAASLAFVLYEWLLNMDREVDFVWKRRWTIGKVLYILCRYGSISDLVVYAYAKTRFEYPLSFCRVWPTMFLVVSLTHLHVPEILTLLRVNALYRWNHKVLALILCIYTSQVIVHSATAGISLRLVKVIDRPPNSLIPGCMATGDPSGLRLGYAACAVNTSAQIFYFLLILLRSRYHITKSQARYPQATHTHVRNHNKRGGTKTLRLVRLFIRDGALYFFLSFIAQISSTLTTNITPDARASVPVPILMAIHPIMSARLYLNLHSENVQCTNDNETNIDCTSGYRLTSQFFTDSLTMGNI